MELANALLRKGVVTRDDVGRAQAEKKADQELEQAVHLLQVRLDSALNDIVRPIRDEITAWIEDIPIEVLEKWATLDKRGQQVEWSKWLAAYREAN